MKCDWNVGSYAGIAVRVHATFVLLLAWVGGSHLLGGRGVTGAAAAVGFITALFACVVLHEFGHALMARRFGIRTRDITLYPIGGVARLEKMPDDPRQELWVALAGPAVNVVIAAALFIWLQATQAMLPMTELTVAKGPFLERLMGVNVALVAFNMIPAFPMDGGRVVRALLAMRMEYTRATQIAATLGQGMAMLLGLFGVLGNPMLLFIAFFVWIGAGQEAGMVQVKSALGGIPVQRAMITDFETVTPHDPLSRPVQILLTRSQTDFPVVDPFGIVGILTRADLIAGLARNGEALTVRDVMRTDFTAVDEHVMLEIAFARLQECQCRTIAVLRGTELVGMVTMDNMGEFLAVQAALKQAGARHAV
jgi:Zn-dependent protease/CBS domain-containing protein